MDETKQEDIDNSNAAIIDEMNGEDPTTKNSIEMDVAVDEVKELTNDTNTTTPITTTVNIPKEETNDDAKEQNNVEDRSELKKEEEDEKIEDEEQRETAKSTESGKKKRKKSIAVETTATTETDTATKRSSRDRKSVEVYDPKIYDKTDKSIQVIDGRGTALKRIPQCKDMIESAASSSSTDDIQTAFRFVFGSKYKLPPKKDMVQYLLDFNGYLPKKDSSMSKAEQEKADEELEVSEAHIMCIVHKHMRCA
jgi:hypothetical protein